MGFKIVFTKPAIADLDGIVTFISRDNPRGGGAIGICDHREGGKAG